MDCHDIQAHLPDHLAGSLPVSQASAVAAHLAICPMCAAEFEELGQTWDRLGELFTADIEFDIADDVLRAIRP